MKIKEQLKKELVEAIKSGSTGQKANIRIVLAEFDRIGKDPSDEEAIKVLKKLEKYEIERLTYSAPTTSDYLEFIQSYLPKKVSDEEIISWVENNVNFSLLKNSMQAIGMVIRQFGQTVDGKTVKRIVQEGFSHHEVD